MQPFNLEKALAGDPVITRDGRKVTDIIQYKSYLIGTLGEDKPFSYKPFSWFLSGIYYKDHSACNIDLFMAPKDEIRYMNVYDDIRPVHLHPTIDDAKSKSVKDGTARSISKLTIRNGEIISIETVHKY